MSTPPLTRDERALVALGEEDGELSEQVEFAISFGAPTADIEQLIDRRASLRARIEPLLARVAASRMRRGVHPDFIDGEIIGWRLPAKFSIQIMFDAAAAAQGTEYGQARAEGDE